MNVAINPFPRLRRMVSLYVIGLHIRDAETDMQIYRDALPEARSQWEADVISAALVKAVHRHLELCAERDALRDS